MYYAIGASVSSLHRESTDSLIPPGVSDWFGDGDCNLVPLFSLAEN